MYECGERFAEGQHTYLNIWTGVRFPGGLIFCSCDTDSKISSLLRLSTFKTPLDYLNKITTGEIGNILHVMSQLFFTSTLMVLTVAEFVCLVSLLSL